MGLDLATSFWPRMGLRDEARDVCMRAIESLYPDSHVKEFSDQGYCSFTLSIDPYPSKARPSHPADAPRYIVQIRPKQHSIDLAIASAAQSTYGNLAPKTRQLSCTLPDDLTAVEMQRLPGVPLPKIPIHAGTLEQRTTLVQSFAKAMAMSWPAPEACPPDRHTRADTPTELHWIDQSCTGRVGRVLVSKLHRLATHLPAESLRERAKGVLARLMDMEHFPVVLNHGDLIPSNVLVDPETWAVTGLVDWAEAERLPFGTCLYGVEYLLGGLVRVGDGGGVGWRYGDGSEELRGVFWEALVRECSGLEGRREEVECMRDVGVLLWYGYAWDEGRIDRVVNEVDDAAEVACLRAFLDAE